MLLVKGRGGLRGEGFAGSHHGGSISVEVHAIIFQGVVGGLFLPVFTKFAKDEERGGLTEGFLEPLVFVAHGLEVGPDVGEFMGKLVDAL